MMKNPLFKISCLACLLLLAACNTKTAGLSEDQQDTPGTDKNAVSVYPLNGKGIELQTLQATDDIEDHRNIKKTDALKSNLATTAYSQYCMDSICIKLSANGLPEIIPAKGQTSVPAEANALQFILPRKNGWVTAISLKDENIFTIKGYDTQLTETWSTIYERSKTDDVQRLQRYAAIAGYNNDILVFHSDNDSIRKSGYIDLNNGQKKLADEQWAGLLLDSDHKTVLGELLKNEDLSYAIKIGDRLIRLPASVTGYPNVNLLNAGTRIFLGFYYPDSDIVKIMAMDYHTGKMIWEYQVLSRKTVKGLLFSSYEDALIIEILSNQDSGLYILNMEKGSLLAKF